MAKLIGINYKELNNKDEDKIKTKIMKTRGAIMEMDDLKIINNHTQIFKKNKWKGLSTYIPINTIIILRI